MKTFSAIVLLLLVIYLSWVTLTILAGSATMALCVIGIGFVQAVILTIAKALLQ